MFKTNRILGILIFVFIALGMIGCGDRGSTTKSDSEQSNTITATVGSNGGTITLTADGAAMTIDSGILKETTSATITKYDAPVTALESGTTVSATYVVEISPDAIADSSGEAEDYGVYLTLEIPISSTSSAASSARRSSSFSDNTYKLARVVIDYGSGTTKLFGSYVVSSGKATIRVTKAEFEKVKQKVTSAKIKIEAAVVYTAECFGVGVVSKLYQVNSSSDFVEITSSPTLNGKTPLILIHGWAMLVNATCIVDPHESAWINFINYFYASSELNEKYVLFSYRYDSDETIDDNAQALKSKIDNIFGSEQKVDIVAHSMGGLLAHTYIQKYGGNSKISKLITLGTPYHGTPIVQALQQGVSLGGVVLQSGIVMEIPAFLALTTPGTFDLKWDNFDSNSFVLTGNDFLSSLGSNNSDLYTVFGGDITLEGNHPSYYGGYSLLKLLDYDPLDYSNDGIVPLVSAYFKEFSSGSYTSRLEEYLETEYDHTQLHEGKNATDPLFDEIKSELLSTSAVTGSLQGYVKDAVTSGALSSATINVYDNNSALATSLTTDSSGVYTANLSTGTYSLTVTKTGYLSENISNVSIQENVTTTVETVLQVSTEYSGTGTISGTIKNALDGTGVSEVSINFRSGINVFTGTISATATTDSSGGYSVSTLSAGNYTGEAVKSGYTTAYFTATVIGEQTNYNQDATITPVLSSGETRIILTWGSSPSDLDSHLTGPISGSSDRFHVYYSDKGSSTSSPYAALDVDDTSSYGPETTTIYQQIDGTYRYSIHDYSNGSSTSSTALSNSSAQVTVYKGSSLVATFNVPANQEGTLWTVFEMSGDTITPINTMSYESSSSAVRVPGLRGSQPPVSHSDAPLMRNLPGKR